jgi:MoaA/NifB/PqqE/SkfB family radical SAM enzyme
MISSILHFQKSHRQVDKSKLSDIMALMRMVKRAPSIVQNTRTKLFRSSLYNYTFDLRSGHFSRWGKRPESDPAWSPYGPEILDIEISQGGGCPMSCAVCYKGNGKVGRGRHMSFSLFKNIFDKLPNVVLKSGKGRIFFITQIAFGVTSVTAHPELWEIFDYCRENGVIPNVTFNGAELIMDRFLERLVDTCGSIAVSVNETNFDRAIDTIKRMTDLGAIQINIHYVLSEQSVDFLYDKLMPAIKEDFRLRRMNALVLLGVKLLRGGVNYNVLPVNDYMRLVKYLMAKKINFGFDSCSAPRFERAVSFLELTHNEKADIIKRSERCESGLYSGYIDCNGKYWHCSFAEGDEKKGGGIDVAKVSDFLKEVWMSDSIKKWRCELIHLNRECPLFPELGAFK